MNSDSISPIGARAPRIQNFQAVSPQTPVQGDIKADASAQVSEKKPATVLSEGTLESPEELKSAKTKAENFASAWQADQSSSLMPNTQNISKPENTSFHGVPGNANPGFTAGTVYASKPLAN